MKCINILFGVYAENYLVFVEMLGKGKLAENAVYLFVCIELINKCVKLLLSCLRGKLVCLGVEAYLLAGFSLISYVYLRCRVFSNDYYSKSGAVSVFSGKCLGLCLYFRAYLCGYSFPSVILAIFLLLIYVIHKG